MGRDEIVGVLRAQREELARLGVRAMRLFGSVARGEAGPRSDVDILVDFGGATTFDQYMDVKLFLEDLLQMQVDLVTERGLRPRVRPHVEQDAIRVA